MTMRGFFDELEELEGFEDLIVEKSCPKCESTRLMVRLAMGNPRMRCMGCLEVFREELVEVKTK